MNHWKIPTYILKILKLLWKFGTSDTSSGPRDTMGKGLETAVVKKAGPQGGSGMAARLCYGFSSRSSSCWGPGRPAGHPGATGKPAGPRPRHPSAWLGWGGGGWFLVLVFGVVFFFFLAVWKKKQKARLLLKLAHSDTLGQTLDTTLERGLSLAPELKAPEKITCFLLSLSWPSRRALAHTYRGTHAVTTALFQEIRILSFIIFFWLKWHYIKFSFESFSVVFSYIAQFRNLSETDLISNLTGKDHIHVYVVIHFYFIGLTQDHFSDENCVPSGLAETVLHFSETLKSPIVV